MSSKKTNIIFESAIRGHVLEYLHNIYMYAMHSDNNYVFLLPQSFEKSKNILDWPEAANISFHFITDEEATKCNQPSMLKSALARSRCIRKYAKQFNACNVFLIFLIRTMPFLPFLLPRDTKASGIIYAIPLYKPTRSKVQKIKDRIIYKLFACKKSIKNILLLNAPRSVEFYNKKYGTDKFVCITDPITEIDMSQVTDLREELGIPQENTVYLQFGSMNNRKNTLNILRAIKLMSPQEQESKTFVFMGKFYDNIRDEFNILIEELKEKVQIIVKEGFVPYEFLNSMCYTADIILTIYTNVEMSSGTIGYAAYFGKPVIGPSVGLLGNLIKDNNLGLTIDKVSPESIKEALLTNIQTQRNQYKDAHTVDSFCRTIIDTLKN